MALHEIRKLKEHDVVGLLTAIHEDDEQVTMHGVSRELLEMQAQALELPLEFIHVPRTCNNRVYSERLNATLTPYKAMGVQQVAFGDLFLDDIRDFREECLEAVGMEAVFPLWHRDTKELSWSFVNLRYKAVVTCIDETCLTAAFAGRVYDRTFLADLPLAVDPCGENGEFHTFVYDGPAFAQAVPIKLGGRRTEAPYHYCEIVPREISAPPALARVRSL
jgi:uncharacterized protein (TIGR00290 family)